ncbi:MAG: GAF domain-containing SpoIIE family protein phosphatase, partial [Acidimicrobiia bacterium]
MDLAEQVGSGEPAWAAAGGGGAGRDDALHRLDRAVADAGSVEELCRAVVEVAVSASGAEAGSIVLLDEGGEWVRLVASTGYAPDVVARFERFRADADVPLAEAIRTSRTLVLGDPAAYHDRYDEFRVAAVAAGRSGALCIPLPIDGRAVGALGLSFGADRTGSAEDPDRWAAFGRRAAAALARILVPEEPERLREMVAAARSRLAFVSAAGRELARSLDRSAVLATLTRLVVPRFADWASVLLPEGDELVAATLVHRGQDDDAGEDRAGRFRCPVDAPGAAAAAYRHGGPLLVAGVDDEVRARIAVYPELAGLLATTTSRFVVPMTFGDRTLGVLTLAECRGRPLDADDRAVLAELAARAGTALEHAERYGATSDMVELLQRAVLPRAMPGVPGLDLAARYLPATVGVLVGGDWYDAFAVRDGRIALCVGDIAGHGLEAAACMAQVRNALRVYALDDPEPSSVVTRLITFAVDAEITRVTTVLYALVD